MVSKHSAICSPATGSLIGTEASEQEGAGSLSRELALLFGEQVFRDAETCQLSSLDFTASDIVAAARWIRRLEGQPIKQREAVECLPADVQIALCRWIWNSKAKAEVLAMDGVQEN